MDEMGKAALSQKINSAIASKATGDIRGVEIFVNGNSIFSNGVQSSEFSVEEMNKITESADNSAVKLHGTLSAENETKKILVMSKDIKSLNTGSKIGFINIYVSADYFLKTFRKLT